MGVKVLKKSPFCQKKKKKKKKKNWGKPPSFVQNTHFGGKLLKIKISLKKSPSRGGLEVEGFFKFSSSRNRKFARGLEVSSFCNQ